VSRAAAAVSHPDPVGRPADGPAAEFPALLSTVDTPEAERGRKTADSAASVAAALSTKA
jgi:hypothetical protein